MKLNQVIRKYRKAKGLTQEEMAMHLGVTAPAVNKWENGNAMPDLTLIAPIARLLDVSLNELLSFKEELTKKEIEELVKEAEIKFAKEEYNDVFIWAKEQIQLYPNCEQLIYSLTLQLDSNRIIQDIPENIVQDKFIISCYERLLKSDDETMRSAAANSLYIYYLQKKQYDKAEEYLSFFSIENPERKRKLALIYEKKGDLQKACQTYEEILMSEYQIISLVFTSLFILQLENKDLNKAKYYAEKNKCLARLFEMGEYNFFAADLELAQAQKDQQKTLECAKEMLNNIDSIYAFSSAPLYSHMKFKNIDPTFLQTVRKNLLDSFRCDDSFAYMKNNPQWNQLISKFE